MNSAASSIPPEREPAPLANAMIVPHRNAVSLRREGPDRTCRTLRNGPSWFQQDVPSPSISASRSIWPASVDQLRDIAIKIVAFRVEISCDTPAR